ncbi:MAG: hypothetical protein ACUVRC_05695 [Desulfotomaculales bacterium]
MLPSGRSLRFQILVIITGILIILIWVMVYDLIYAGRTDQMLLVHKEERLAAVVQFLAAGVVTTSFLSTWCRRWPGDRWWA